MGLSQNLIDTLYRNTHEHIFNNGETVAEQAEAIEGMVEMAREAGIYSVHKVEDGKVTFGFENADHRIAFGMNTMSPESGDNFRHTHNFECPVIQEIWTELAVKHCELLGIDVEVEQDDLRTRFHFDNAHAGFAFQSLANSGTLDAQALSIDRMQKALADAIGTTPEELFPDITAKRRKE